MKVKYLSNDNFVVYLNKHYIKDLDIDDKKSIEAYFKKIFVNLKNNHNVNINGYYNIKVYINNRYGLVIDAYRLNNEYFKLYGNKVDMKITIDTNNRFLYEIEDYFLIDKLKNNINEIYYKDDKYYIEINESIDDRNYNFLLENSIIIYSDEVYDILSLCDQL
jgi:hypothetical protein